MISWGAHFANEPIFKCEDIRQLDGLNAERFASDAHSAFDILHANKPTSHMSAA